MKKTFKKIIVRILTYQAKLVLRRYKPHIIAVTGSVGKTSTKDAIYTVLKPLTHIRKSDKSFNSELGVPLSILGLPNAWNNPFLWIKNIIAGFFLIIVRHTYPTWLVLEVGADTPGDIKSIAPWLRPDVVVITRFPDVPVHIEFFESKEQVIKEKTSLAKKMNPDGLLVLNADDPVVMELANKYGARTITFGASPEADVRAKESVISYIPDNTFRFPYGREFVLVTREGVDTISLPHVISDSHVQTILASIAVGTGIGFALPDLIKNVSSFEPPKGRLSVIPGIRDSSIIDDTYNSSPVAAESAIELLKQITAPGRIVVVLGDMLELGKYTQPAHRELGKAVLGVADVLITVGIRATFIDEGAKEAGMNPTKIHHFETSDQAADYLSGTIMPGDIILVKGSQGIRMEKIVKKILRDPSIASEVLVRQEKEWLDR